VALLTGFLLSRPPPSVITSVPCLPLRWDSRSLQQSLWVRYTGRRRSSLVSLRLGTCESTGHFTLFIAGSRLTVFDQGQCLFRQNAHAKQCYATGTPRVAGVAGDNNGELFDLVWVRFAGIVESRLSDGDHDALSGYRRALYLGIGLAGPGLVMSVFFMLTHWRCSRNFVDWPDGKGDPENDLVRTLTGGVCFASLNSD
jgi:hypothetical protein